ncbi:VENN motif pre-toxin domain-containing protein [Moellerella wisconsensis]|uniref:VENN motif pre-toxin domain-containing protein n=1 Tax=Moellerella wisconsensis TaxID=158849 RepID=UPI0009E5382F
MNESGWGVGGDDNRRIVEAGCAFSSLAASIAGGFVGGDTTHAATAVQSGKTTIENSQVMRKLILMNIKSQISLLIQSIKIN